MQSIHAGELAKEQANMYVWADATIMDSQAMLQPECFNVQRPTWWNEGELIQISGQVLALRPTNRGAWAFRGRVLGYPSICGGKVSAVSAARFAEAAICFERAAELQDLADRTANAKQLRDEVNLMRANAEMWSRPHGLSQSHGCVDFSTERAMAQWRERMSLQSLRAAICKVVKPYILRSYCSRTAGVRSAV